MEKDFDFAGWATRYGVKCADGRTLLHGAFSANDGQRVPLCWNHNHDDPNRVLGYAVLENRDDGVYAYGYFNDTTSGQNARQYVQHGDVTSLSIYANQLKEKTGFVEHGNIRELSLVLAGANPYAKIETVICHSDDSDGEAIIYNDEGSIDTVVDYDDSESIARSEEVNEVMDEKSQENKKEKTVQDVIDSMTEEQQTVLYALVGEALNMSEDNSNKNIAHSEEANKTMDEKEKTVKDVIDSMTEEQQDVLHILAGMANSGKKTMSDNDKAMFVKVLSTMNDEQKNVLRYIIGEVLNKKNQEDDNMKHSIFASDKEAAVVNKTMELFQGALEEAKNTNAGSFRALLNNGGEELAHGIDNLDYLFPDAKTLTEEPVMIKENDAWVSVVMNGIKHTPFSRIKSIFADITDDEARAKGYIKGNRKSEEIFSLLKRITVPTTVYKKQKFDRDDIIDITDFDVIQWVKKEMRIKLNEELARAVLISDGRPSTSNDKIDENCIRPIWTDDELFTIKAEINAAPSATLAQKAEAFVDAAIRARKNYHGTGKPTCFASEDVITECLLLKDGLGYRLYKSEAELATALRVKEIVSVPCMENLTRTANGNTYELMAIIVNLADYNMGADKGGAVNFFDDFDIDFNQYKYLIETRCSGALTIPFSAIAVESKVAATFEVAPCTSATIADTSVSDLQEGIQINVNSIQGTLKYYDDESSSLVQTYGAGNFLALSWEAPVGTSLTVGLEPSYGSSPVEIDEDMESVHYITNKNTQKLVVEATKSGVTLKKTYSLKSLRLETPNA